MTNNGVYALKGASQNVGFTKYKSAIYKENKTRVMCCEVSVGALKSTQRFNISAAQHTKAMVLGLRG